MTPSKHFFDTVRLPLFGGRLTTGQVDGMNRIVAEARSRKWGRAWLAYALATALHETGGWMQPIREGALRYGPDYTDAQSRRAVTAAHAKGIIRVNYSLPTGQWKQSYYGRGLVQITWLENYLKLGKAIGLGDELAKNPDKALEWDVALDLLFVGMSVGLYTGKALKHYKLPAEFAAARRIINGDVKKNGPSIAEKAECFYAALEGYPE